MATAIVSAAFSLVGKALSPLTDGLLKDWAASVELGDNVEALEQELLAVQALLEHTIGKEIVDNSALKKMLLKLQDLGYDADDVLDELDYFRIQDELDGTFDAADKHAKGVTHNLAFNVRHTAKAVGKQIWLPSCFSSAASSEAKANPGVNRQKAKLNSRSCCNPIHTVGKCFPCSSPPLSVPTAAVSTCGIEAGTGGLRGRLVASAWRRRDSAGAWLSAAARRRAWARAARVCASW